MKRPLAWLGLVVVSAIVARGSFGFAARAADSNRVSVTAVGVASGTPGAADPLAGRLGGTVTEFEAAYGAPVGAGRGGLRYDVAGYGLVSVEYAGQADGTDAADRARVILFAPPRPADKPGTVPDAADWRVAEARRQALRFLPRDAALGEEIVLTEASMAVECRSAALTARFAAERRGSCLVAFTTTTAGRVSLVRLVHTAGLPDAAAATEPCAGIFAWAAATAGRIETAAALLAGVGAIAEDDPAAGAELRRLGEGFARLAVAQREATAPGAAADATVSLIRAFDGYASAMAVAAAAIEQGDAAEIDRAAAVIDQADASVERGTEALHEAFAVCGVDVATPAA